jgi:lysophospholipase L1-like esterase
MRSRLVIILFFTSLIVICSLLLVCKLNSYKDYLRYRLDPLEEYRLESRSDPEENGFWIIGDSHAAGWETSQLDFIRIKPVNMGIGGQTSRQVLERFRNDLDLSRPYCVLIQVGINDLKCIGLLKDESITHSCIRNILEILETCKKQEINAIYSSIFPVGDIELYRKPFWEPTTIDSLLKVNDKVRDYCRQNGFIYFDTYNLLENQVSPGSVATEYQKDFLHINVRGYEHLSNRLHELLGSYDEDWVKCLVE